MDRANWFGARLRELRGARGWTQRDLAERADLPTNTVSRFERGELVPLWTKVVLLADALGVSLDEFAKKPKDATPRGRGRPRSKPDKPRRHRKG
jgi:transcriptional regulator with XRE-family HTH domain